MNADPLKAVSKDDLVLATLAALGGETTEVNERDLFLACWHAFPATMRWVDTALPNPDTFTASLRRLDQRGYILRLGKQKRQKGRKRAPARRKTVLDAPGKAAVVKARIAEGGLEAAKLDRAVVERVAGLLPSHSGSGSLSDAKAIAVCVALREKGGRGIDEGALVELAFHRFPDHFAYAERPEFPDLEKIRKAITSARQKGLLEHGFKLTAQGRAIADDGVPRGDIGLESANVPARGELRIAARIESGQAYRDYVENGTLATTKADELYRALRVPPTTDPRPVADALRTRVRGLRRIDKGEVAAYLLAVAARHNPDAFEQVRDLQDELVSEDNAGGAKRNE
jgi:hypothetical protein